MFTSLRNRFLNYRTCLLCFEINFRTIERVRFASSFKFFNINMYALLWNEFSNYRTCSLRFDIEENIIFEAFASLRFASLRFDSVDICLWCFWTCLHYRGLCSRVQWFATNFAESSCFMWRQPHIRPKNDNIAKKMFSLQWSLSYFDVVFVEKPFFSSLKKNYSRDPD
jgi:hypothetical protein